MQSTMLRYFTKVLCTNKLNNLIQLKNLTHKSFSTNQNIVWIDMEMTGLKVDTDRVLEIACLVTDKNLNIISNEANFVIHQSNEVLNSMDEWCISHHGETGLTEASKNSKYTEIEVEQEILNLIAPYTIEKKNPMAGNSIYMDRLFLIKYMPTLNEYLNYRIIDVSSVKELCRRWDGKIFSEAPKKRLVHRALDDIRESISELSYYKTHFFNK